MRSDSVVLGIFVGGGGRRMGGRDKAGLPSPGGGVSLLQRQADIGAQLGFEVVVMGARVHAPGAPLPAPVHVQLPDAPAGIGPLGAMGPLLRYAGDRPAIALACDMPYVTAALLRRLASEQPGAAVLAPRVPGSEKWMPLCARYASVAVLPALQDALEAQERALQAWLRRVPVTALSLSPGEMAALRDWDTPDDMRG